MLEHMGYLDANAAIVQAIEKVLAAGPDNAPFTPDIGGTGIHGRVWQSHCQHDLRRRCVLVAATWRSSSRAGFPAGGDGAKPEGTWLH